MDPRGEGDLPTNPIPLPEGDVWAKLAELWSALGPDLWAIVPESRAVCTSIPDDEAENSIVLREARSSARTPHTDHPDSRVGANSSNRSRPEEGSSFADDAKAANSLKPSDPVDAVAIRLIQSVRQNRQLGAYREALEISASGLQCLHEHEVNGRIPTPRNFVRMLLEIGRTELAAGSLGRAKTFIGQSVQVAVAYLPHTSGLRSTSIAWDQYVNLGARSEDLEPIRTSVFERLHDERSSRQSGLPPEATESALKALARLDLHCPSFDELEKVIASAPCDLATITSVVSIQRDLLLGEHSRALLTLEQCTGKHAASLQEAPALDYALTSARHMILLHGGDAYRAQLVMGDMARLGKPTNSVESIRFNLATGNSDRAVDLAVSAQSDAHLPASDKGTISLLKSAALSALGRHDQASYEFLSALKRCAISGSLVPVAQIPSPLRDALVMDVADAPEWREVGRCLNIEPSLAMERVLGCKSHPVNLFIPELLPRDVQLLEHLEHAQSVAEIARRMSIAEGTARNNLSSLYRKLGATGWSEALKRAYHLGILPLVAR